MGGNPEIIVEKPWIDEIIDEDLTEDELARIQRTLDFEFSESPKIRLIPLDLTKHSPTCELQGQALLGYLSISPEDKDKLRQAPKEISYHIHFLIDVFVPTIKVKYHNQVEQTTLEAEIISGLRELQEIMENCKTSLPEKAVLNGFLSRSTKELSTYTTRDLLQPIYALDNIWVTNEEYVKKLVEQECKEDSKAKECFENMLECLHSLLRLKNKITNLKREIEIRLNRMSEKLPPEIREHPQYINYWLSHNGIIVPRRKYDTPPSPFPEDKSSMLTLKNPFERISSDRYSGMIQYIALRDSLRPDVSLARDQLRELSWNIYSAITLAFARAIRAYPEEVIPDYHLNIF